MVISAALFGMALFGRRPIPQPAMVGSTVTRDGAAATEIAPSGQPGDRAGMARVPGVGSPVMIAPPSAAGHIDAGAVRVPTSVRLRSLAVLVVSVVGVAVLVGAVLSIVVVGAVLLIA